LTKFCKEFYLGLDCDFYLNSTWSWVLIWISWDEADTWVPEACLCQALVELVDFRSWDVCILGTQSRWTFSLLSLEIAFFEDGVYLPGLAYPQVLVSWLIATNFPWTGIDWVAHGSSYGPIWVDLLPTMLFWDIYSLSRLVVQV
jgi:hypothetical protein